MPNPSPGASLGLTSAPVSSLSQQPAAVILTRSLGWGDCMWARHPRARHCRSLPRPARLPTPTGTRCPGALHAWHTAPVLQLLSTWAENSSSLRPDHSLGNGTKGKGWRGGLFPITAPMPVLQRKLWRGWSSGMLSARLAREQQPLCAVIQSLSRSPVAAPHAPGEVLCSAATLSSAEHH